MTDRSPDRPADQGRAAQPASQPAGAIDVRKLAEKVYQLMQAEIRLEQARGAGAPRKRGQ